MASMTEEYENGDVFNNSLQERRLILIGKTGNGKSSVGNLLLGKSHFRVGFSMTSTTVSPASGSVHFRGWKITVLDTPDICNLPQWADEDEAQREVSTWKSLTSPEVHAILLAVRCDVRYTREEYEIFLRLKNLWGGKPLTRRLIVAFTFGDRQDRDLQEDLRVVCTELKSVLKEASQRYILFNDRDSPEGKQRQVLHLLTMVDRLDAEVLRKEEGRLLRQVQVCPMGPVPPPHSFYPPSSLQRSFSGGSSASRGSCSTDPDFIKLILVGKPGTGKSSTGNTILGRAVLPVHHSGREPLHASLLEEVVIEDKLVQVIDTPGLQSQSGGPSTQDKDYQRERRRASELITPGPHALLYVVRHRDVTQEDLNGFRTFKQGLGQGLSHHTIVVLVGSRRQGTTASSPLPDPRDGKPPSSSEGPKCSHSSLTSSSSSSSSSPGQGRKHPSSTGLEESRVVVEEGEVFQALLQEAGGKLWTVDNPSVEVGARQQQVTALLALVQGILNNSGGDYFHGDRVAPEFGKKRGLDDGRRSSSCWFL